MIDEEGSASGSTELESEFMPHAHTDELLVLLEEYKQLSTQASSRYLVRYQFHNLAILIVSVLATIYATKPQHEWVLLLGPTAFVSLMLLMLKQHAYVDLRNTYIHLVLRPRLTLLLTKSADPKMHVLGWTAFEQTMLRGKRTSARWLQPYAVVEYILPFICSVACTAAFCIGKVAAWHNWEVAFVAFNVAITLSVLLFLWKARVKTPHLNPS